MDNSTCRHRRREPVDRQLASLIEKPMKNHPSCRPWSRRPRRVGGALTKRARHGTVDPHRIPTTNEMWTRKIGSTQVLTIGSRRGNVTVMKDESSQCRLVAVLLGFHRVVGTGYRRRPCTGHRGRFRVFYLEPLRKYPACKAIRYRAHRGACEDGHSGSRGQIRGAACSLAGLLRLLSAACGTHGVIFDGTN